jgi:hypothetical protein
MESSQAKLHSRKLQVKTQLMSLVKFTINSLGASITNLPTRDMVSCRMKIMKLRSANRITSSVPLPTKDNKFRRPVADDNDIRSRNNRTLRRRPPKTLPVDYWARLIIIMRVRGEINAATSFQSMW